jgi:uncharacterized protein (DUF433 family)
MRTPNTIISLLQRAPLDLTTGCWSYTGRVDSKGFAKATIKQKEISVHREIYQFLNGRLPTEQVVTQTCLNRRCVNPEHLKSGLQKDVSPKPDHFCHTFVTLATKTRINPHTNCWEWQGCVAPDGYGQVSKEDKTWPVHRLMYTFLHGDISKDIQVCHVCDVRHCLNPEHLFLGTAKDNYDDMVSKGRRVTREFSLSPDQKRQAIQMRQQGLRRPEIAEYFDVSETVIYRVLKPAGLTRSQKRMVTVTNLITGEETTFSTIQECADFVGINKRQIFDLLRYNKSYKGFQFSEPSKNP